MYLKYSYIILGKYLPKLMFNFLYPEIQKFKHHFKMYFPDRHTIIGPEKYFPEYNFKFVFKKVLFRCQKILKSIFWNLIKKNMLHLF